jgi:hypothetical protein
MRIEGEIVAEHIDEAVERRRALAVASTGLAGSDASERFDRITRAAREQFHVPLALVNLVDDSTIETISGQPGGDRWVTPFGKAFCETTVRQGGILTVPDTVEDERFRDREGVVANGIRFYAGIPLALEDETPVATLCLLDTSPRALTDDEEERFRSFGEWAQSTIRATTDRRHRDRSSEPGWTPGSRAVTESATVGNLTVHSLDLPWGTTSGDFRSHAEHDDLVGASLGDVMGKGERAGRLGALIASELGRVDPSPSVTLAAAQRAAHESVSSADAFATLFHAVVDSERDAVRFVDAGHGLTLHIGRDGSVTRLSSPDLPFGLQEPDEGWHESTITLAPGDALVSMSDGVLDLYDGTLAALDEVAAVFGAAPDIDAFFAHVERRAQENPPDDDITILVVSRADA